MSEVELVRYVERIVKETKPASQACYLRPDITQREAEIAQMELRRRDRPGVNVSRGRIVMHGATMSGNVSMHVLAQQAERKA